MTTSSPSTKYTSPYPVRAFENRKRAGDDGFEPRARLIGRDPSDPRIYRERTTGSAAIPRPRSRFWNIRISRAGYCEKFFQETWPILFSEYIDTGKVRLVYRDFPRALSGSERGYRPGCPDAPENRDNIGRCHDRLFAGGNKFSPAQLRQQAEELRLNAQQFNSCFEAAHHTKDIFKGPDRRRRVGCPGHPVFYFVRHESSPGGPLCSQGPFPTRHSRKKSTSCSKRQRHPKVLPIPCKMRGETLSSCEYGLTV